MPAITARGLLGSGSATTAGTTLAVTNTTGAVIPAGTFIHITGCWDNIASVTAPTITSSTVGAGTAIANHATAVGSGVTTTAGSGIWHQCFRVLTTSDIAAGATIATLTSNQSAVKRAAHAEGFNNALTTLRGTVTTATSTTGSPSVTTTGTALVIGDLVIGSVSNENNAQMTADADTAGGSWPPIVGVATSGGAAGTNCNSGSQYKILTATGTQTFNPTGGVLDTVACVYSVQAAPDPSITQAAYRFYADGTESGSTALGTQSTSYTADISGGDVNLGLRVRLQSTTAVAVSATDDWQLQWDKNASGTWTKVAADSGMALADAYATSNQDDFSNFATPGDKYLGQTFLGNGESLVRASFYLLKIGVPATTLTSVLWSHTGTFGSTGVGNALLASSTTSLAGTSLTTSYALYDFDFVPYRLDSGVPYVITAKGVDGATSNEVRMGADSSTPTHSGNGVVWPPWTALARDLVFQVYTQFFASTVVPYNSANLTDAAATTNRLGAGTGSFVAGEISETGLATDLGWTANNYTELLYSITLKQADLADSDTLTFRVLHNGVTTEMTYTVTPTVAVTAGAAPVNAPAGLASGTGSAGGPPITAVSFTAGAATGTGTAYDATVSVATVQLAPAEVAAGTGAALNAATADAPGSSPATGTGSASAAASSTKPNAGAAGAGGSATALLLNDPCDNFSFAPWVNGGSTTIAPGFLGDGFSFPSGATNTASYNVLSGDQTDTLTVGFWLKLGTLVATHDILTFRSDTSATLHDRLRVGTDGSVSVVRASTTLGTPSAAGTIATGTWYFVEAQVKLHDTAGTMEVRVDGTTVTSATGADTKNAGTKTVFDGVRFTSVGATTTWQVDEIYIRNDATFGVAATGATGTAYNPTVTTTVATNAPAGAATGTGAATNAATSVSFGVTTAAGTGAASNATASPRLSAGVGSGSGTASNAAPALTTSPAAATGTGSAYQATVSTSSATSANAGHAAGTGAANSATASPKPNAGSSSGTGAAYNATVTTAVQTSAAAGHASGSGAALAPSAAVKVNAERALGLGAAHSASTATARIANANAAAGTGQAFDARTYIALAAAPATGSGAAFDAEPVGFVADVHGTITTTVAMSGITTDVGPASYITTAVNGAAGITTTVAQGGTVTVEV